MTNAEAIFDLEQFALAPIGDGDLHRESIELALSALREQAERDKGCDGCAESGKWENEFEYGYSCPCLPCSRRCSDGYKPKEAQHE